jgi:nickel/cobalt transporter (NiCoT) family protein
VKNWLMSRDTRRTLVALVGLHVLAWGLLSLNTGAGSTITLSTGLTAYLLGLRHAFDADHITAIDNTTRKLVSEGRKAHSVGLFFALGHSTVVVAATVLLVAGAAWVGSAITTDTSAVRHLGGLVGGLMSGGFLLVMAALNSVVLVALLRSLRSVREGHASEGDISKVLDTRGAMSRLLRPVNRLIDRPGKMYVMGLLFGLGFDTATSIALMVMSSVGVLAGSSVWAAIAVPLTFTAGMALGDSLDGLLMQRAYTWATDAPVQRAQYNVAVTTLSIAAALAIGLPTLAGVSVTYLGWHQPVLELLSRVSFEYAGLALFVMFMSFWAVSFIVWRSHRNRP